MIEQAIERVRQMEKYFDMLQDAVNTNPKDCQEDAYIKEILLILIQYYEGGQWLQDYELDEKGLFPKDLKRGILAQDSVYDLLEQINKMPHINCRAKYKNPSHL